MTPLTKRNLSRRAVLRGAGVALGLPWLEAMAHAAGRVSAAAKPPVRMAALYMPNGAYPATWTPEGEGRDFKLSYSLDPLETFHDDILVLSNLWNEQAKDGDGHYVKESAILTCRRIKKTQGADLENGVSVDQAAAKAAGRQTPLPSLELGITPVAVGNDAVVGYTRVYGSHISWSSPTTPLARELNPRAVYERLFRAATGGAEDEAKLDALLLDRVLDDAKKLQREVGVEDRHRLDEYLSVMRSLEERIERAQNPSANPWQPLKPLDPNGAPEGQPSNHLDHVRLMLDMIAVAFQSDTTRISTFMFGNAVSNVSFRWLDGVSAGHHDVSHHANEPEKLAQYQIINRWHIEQYAYLLGRLREMKEGDSNVLDNSMILFASALSDGNRHDPHKLPVVLAGRAGGRLDTGQHLVYAEDSQLANLYVSMLDAFGAPVERFADSTGPLRGVLKG